jgi:predicted lipid carrier protein YhbT
MSADTTTEFFKELADRGHEPLWGKLRGTVRFDLRDGQQTDHWLVQMDSGDVTVSRAERAADCTIRAEKALFERLVRGEANAVAAVLRGAIVCTGDVELLLAIQRVFPGPPKKQQTAGRAKGSQ